MNEPTNLLLSLIGKSFARELFDEIGFGSFNVGFVILQHLLSLRSLNRLKEKKTGGKIVEVHENDTVTNFITNRSPIFSLFTPF